MPQARSPNSRIARPYKVRRKPRAPDGLIHRKRGTGTARPTRKRSRVLNPARASRGRVQGSGCPCAKADYHGRLDLRLVADQFPQWEPCPIRPVEARSRQHHDYAWPRPVRPAAQRRGLRREGGTRSHRWLPLLAASAFPCKSPNRLRKACRGRGFPPALVRAYRWSNGDTGHRPRGSRTCEVRRRPGPLHRAAFTRSTRQGGRRQAHTTSSAAGRSARIRRRDAGRARGVRAISIPRFAAEVWRAELRSTWQGQRLWFHGDAKTGNLNSPRRAPLATYHIMRKREDCRR